MNVRYRRNLPAFMLELGIPMIAVEIGVAEGNFSKDLLHAGIEKLFMCDSWEHLEQKGDGFFEQEWHNMNYHTAIWRTFPYRDKITILRGLSVDMSRQVQDQSLGLVYIDADHSYEGVKSDIEVWYPKLCIGGIMAFHDFENTRYGVKQAAYEFANKNGLDVVLLPEDKSEDAGAYFIKK